MRVGGTMSDNTIDPRRGITRRTLAVGAAWSVPVIAMATAAPAMAVSGPTPSLTYQGACKYPGEGNGPNQCYGQVSKGYGVVMNVVNHDTGNTIYLCTPVISNIQGFSGSVPLVLTYTGPGCLSVAPGANADLNFLFSGNKDSSNQTFTFDFTVNWGHTCPCSADPNGHGPVTVLNNSVASTPPGCTCP